MDWWKNLASRKYHGAVYSPMISLQSAKLAGVVMTLGIVGMAGTNLAFAAQTPCGEQPYVYNVGCMPLSTAHIVGGVMVATIIGFAVAWGIAGVHLTPIKKYI